MSHPAVRVMIKMTLETLSDDELAAVNLALASGGVNPHHLGYEKVKSLLNNDGTAAHGDIIFLIIEEAIKRLS